MFHAGPEMVVTLCQVFPFRGGFYSTWIEKAYYQNELDFNVAIPMRGAAINAGKAELRTAFQQVLLDELRDGLTNPC